MSERGLTFTTEFNLGDDLHNFRVPDFGVHASVPSGLYVATALMVGEILSPDDETFESSTSTPNTGSRRSW